MRETGVSETSTPARQRARKSHGVGSRLQGEGLFAFLESVTYKHPALIRVPP